MRFNEGGDTSVGAADETEERLSFANRIMKQYGVDNARESEEQSTMPEEVLWLSIGYAERRRMAASHETSRDILVKLSFDPLPLVRRAVAANPNSPANVVARLAEESDYTIRAAVASNPNIPEAVMDSLVQDGDYAVRRKALLNPALAESARRTALKSLNSTERTNLAMDTELPVWLMVQLAHDEDSGVRRCLAMNSLCTSEVLRTLSVDQDDGVREEVAGNPFTPAELLMAMRTDPNPQVRRRIAESPLLPRLIREEIVAQQDVADLISKEIKRNRSSAGPEITAKDIHKYVFNEVKEAYRLASSPLAPVKALQELTKIKRTHVLEALAKNPSTSSDERHAIALILEHEINRMDGPYSALSKFADIPDLKEETLRLLATSRYHRVRAAIADDPRIGGDLLDALSHDETAAVRARAARNRNASEAMLRRMASDDDDAVRLSVLCNPRIPRDLISAIYCRRGLALARVLKARNPDVDAAALWEVAMCCPSPYRPKHTAVERVEAAQNPAATPALLELLAQDACIEVRQAVARNVNAPARIADMARRGNEPSISDDPNGQPVKLDEDRKWYLNNAAQHGNLYEKSLWKSGVNDFIDILRSGDSHLLKLLAEYHDIPAYVYEQLAVKNNAGVKERLASRPCLPSHLQLTLTQEHSPVVRRALVRNEFTTIEALDVLCYDLSNEIRNAALRRISRLLS